MASAIKHTHMGQAEQIYNDARKQISDIVIGRKYPFAFPNGAKVIFCYNSRGFIRLYIPVEVTAGGVTGYAFEQMVERGTDGRMIRKSGLVGFCDSLDDADPQLRSLILHNRENGTPFMANYA